MKYGKGSAILLAGLFLGIVVGSSDASQRLRTDMGLFFSHVSQAEFEMTTGVDAVGKPLKARRFEEFRDHLNFPAHYGLIISVHTVGDKTVIWFQDDAGFLRNVVVTGAHERLIRIAPAKTTAFGYRLAR